MAHTDQPQLTQDLVATPADPAGGCSLPRVTGYDVLGEIGRGGMGVVYKARQLGLERVVALKMILAADHAAPHQLTRFAAEAQALARLQHPNIVQIYEVGAEDGRPFFAMEMVPGAGQRHRLQPRGDAPRFGE